MATLHKEILESEIRLKILRKNQMMDEEKELQERRRQTHEVDELVVVDSATDGEEEGEDNLLAQAPAPYQMRCPAQEPHDSD